MPTFQTVRGTRDIINQEAQLFTFVTSNARQTALLYGYKEAITPVVESLDLLSAKSGEEIRQRMFIFEDLGGRKVALRPEFTASIARLATTALRTEPKPLRLFSVGSVYRYDEPQKGRYREFYQTNFELMGSSKPEADAEIIMLTNSVMKSVGLQGYAFKVGHIGVIRGILDQENVDEKTQNAILQKMDKKEYEAAFKLVPTEKCLSMLQGLLKLKSSDCFETIENIKKHVGSYEKALHAAENLHEIVKLVVESGCPIANVDPAFARGLEYYTGMIFELYIPELDIALGGGGRYDKLIEVFGGEATAAVGTAHGVDRVMLALQTQNAKITSQMGKRAAVIAVSDAVKGEALKISQMLRAACIIVEYDVMARKMAKALEDADKRQVDFAIIVGEKELIESCVVVKDLKKREQTTVKISDLVNKIKS